MMAFLRKVRYQLKYAWKGLSRHWVLSLSALGAVSVALFLVGSFLLLGLHVHTFTQNVEDGLRIHVILTPETDEAQAQAFGDQIKGLETVSKADFSNKDQELELMIQEKGEAFSIYRGEQNPLSHAWFVYVTNPEDIQATAAWLDSQPQVASVSYGGASTTSLAEILSVSRWVGYAGSVLLLILSAFLIYNTIRTTIQSRQEEIVIMRQVGAEDFFIKRPFEVEGMLLGAAGALVPFLVLCWAYPALYRRLGGILFANVFTLMDPEQALGILAICLFGGGILIGWLAAFLAVSKYIKSKR